MKALKIAIVLSLLLACAPAPREVPGFDVAQARTAIEEGNRQFMEALARGDAVIIASLYTDAATLLPPGGDPVEGKKAIRDFWHAFIESGAKEVTLTSLDVSGSGEAAYETGRYQLGMEPAEGDPTRVSGKYLVVWRKVGESEWKLHLDIWNVDPAAPETAAEERE